MPLESATFIDGLVTTNPAGGDDKSQGDDHLRLIKSTIKNTFPSITGAVTLTQEQINALASGQYGFPAVQVPSSDPNTLDDYEEGTFVPAITFGGGSTGVTYDIQEGTYTKIGRAVAVRLHIKLTAKGSSTGDTLITGLPFAAAKMTALAMVSSSSLLGSSVFSVAAFVDDADTDVVMFDNSGARVTDGGVFDNSEFLVSGVYFV